LIGAEYAAALKQERDLFERRAPLRHGRPPVPAVLRRNKPTALAALLASRCNWASLPADAWAFSGCWRYGGFLRGCARPLHAGLVVEF
jgi:hypothetical protein